MTVEGTAATYTVSANVDLRALLARNRRFKGLADKRPLRLAIVATQRAWSASWTADDGKERYRLVNRIGQGCHLIDFSSRTILKLDDPLRRERGASAADRRIDIAWSNARHAAHGEIVRGVGHIALRDGQAALGLIEALSLASTTAAPLDSLWAAMAPWLAPDSASRLGLPVTLRLERLGSNERAELHLDSIERVNVDRDAFDLPSHFKSAAPQHQQHRTARRAPAGGLRPAGNDATSPGSTARPLLFTGLGPETVKVVFNQSLIETVFADLRAATSYVSGFRGEGLIFRTADWFAQVVQNAPVPADGQARSVVPALMVRLFLADVCPLLRSLNLSSTLLAVSPAGIDPSQLETVVGRVRTRRVLATVDALPDSDLKSKLQAFIRAVGAGEAFRPFNALLEHTVPGLGPSSPASDVDPCTGLWLRDFSRLGFRNEHWVQLATFWYGLLLPSISLRPTYTSRQQVEDSVAVFHPSGDVTIDEIGNLIDINLNDFEHSITFGSRPLFTPPVHVDGSAFRALGAHLPWLAALRNVRFGFRTEASIEGFDVSFDIETSPAATIEAFWLGFFCPPCVLSLFGIGIVSASVEEGARCDVFIYLEQDPLRLDPPRWRIAVSEPELADVDANIGFLSLNPIVLGLVNSVGNLFGGLIVNELLKSLVPTVAESIAPLLERIPVLDADAIVRVGKPPGLFGANEASRVAYDAPVRSAGGFQFETFRQADRGAGARLDFPTGGATLDSTLAIVLAPHRAQRLAAEVDWPRYFGPFNVRGANGNLAEIDWWTAAPDQTGMPPRPPQVQAGAPPGLLLIPQNVGQRWWSFNTLLQIEIAWLGFRTLVHAPADGAVADVLVNAWCRGEAVETEIIMYEDCHDVSQLAEQLLERWPSRGEPLPNDPRSVAADDRQPTLRASPSGVLVSGKFMHPRGRAGADAEPVPGWADDAEIGYWFGSPGGLQTPHEMPRPDGPGPAPRTGTGICRTVVTRNTRERETWLEASLQFRLPVRVGLTETLDINRPQDFAFLPAIHAALDEAAPADRRFDLFATGPLATLDRAANRDWLSGLLLALATDLTRLTGIARLGPFHYTYGLDALLVTLLPEEFQAPLAQLRLRSVTSDAGAVAFEIDLQQAVLGRA